MSKWDEDMSYWSYSMFREHIRDWGGRLVNIDGKISHMGRNDFGQTPLKNKKTIAYILKNNKSQKVTAGISWSKGLYMEDLKDMDGNNE